MDTPPERNMNDIVSPRGIRRHFYKLTIIKGHINAMIDGTYDYDPLKAFMRRHAYTFAAIAVLLGVSIFGILFTQSRAEFMKVPFYATTCNGDWQHADHAVGAPDGASSFNEENSAFLLPDQVGGRIICNTFHAENVPLDEPLRAVTVKFSWSIEQQQQVSSLMKLFGTPVFAQESSEGGEAPAPVPEPTPVPAPEPNPVPEPTVETVTDPEPVVETTPDSGSVDTDQTGEPQTVSEPEEASSATDETVTPEAPVTVEGNLLKVTYSLDGETWNTLGTVGASDWSNAAFTLEDPGLTTWSDLSRVQIAVERAGDDHSPRIYLDSVYLEASYDNTPEYQKPPVILLKDASQVISGNEDFSSGETPDFIISDPDISLFKVRELINEEKAEIVEDAAGLVSKGTESRDGDRETPSVPIIETIQEIIAPLLPSEAEAADDDSHIVDAVVLDSDGNQTDVTVTITTVVVDGVSKERITINRPANMFRPGHYVLRITLQTDSVVIITEQDFTWGVLSMNMDKSMYRPGETAYLQMGVLDDHGHTLCSADLSLVITSPSGVVSNLSSSNEKIKESGHCAGDTVVTVPDYSGYFDDTNEIGEYKLVLTATTGNGTKTIHDRFKVIANPTFDVVRTAPSRIYPVSSYPVTMRITSPVDWQGTVTETVPVGFTITQPLHSQRYSNVTTNDDVQIITWDVSLSAGEETTIGYYYDAPDISPEFYLIGPLTFYEGNTDIFHESREWQIASDATCAATTSGSWNTGGNWTGCSGTGGRPGTGDNITINNGITITMDANSAVLGTITVNGTLNTSNGTSRSLTGTTLSIGSTGTLTANASTITLSGTTGTPISMTAGGTFTAGTSTVTLTGNNAGGNSTIPSNITYANVVINISGETFVLDGSTTMNGTLTITQGTVDTTTSNYALSVGKISIANSANAILTANASTISVTGTSSTLISKGGVGVFNAGTSTVDITGNGDVTGNSGAITFYNLTLSGTGTKSFVSLNLTITNTLTVNAGVFAVSGISFGYLVIGTNGTYTASSGTITVTGTTGTLLSITGSGVFNAATSTVTLTGNGSNTINTAGFTGSNALNNLSLNITGVTKSLGADLTVNGTTTITLGTLDTTSSNYSLTTNNITMHNSAAAGLTLNGSTLTLTGTSGTLLNKAGGVSVFNAGTSTVNMTGNGNATIANGSPVFYNLISSGTGTKTAGIMTVSNVFTISAGTVAGSSVTITLSGTTGTPFVNNGTFDGGTGTVAFTGNNGSGNTTIPASPTYYNLTVNNTSETYVLAGTTTINNTLTIILGTLNTTGSNYAFTAAAISIANSASAILIANGSTITLNGTGTLFTRGASGVFTQGTSNVTVTSASGTPRLLSAATTFHILTINSASTVVNAGAVITTDNVSGNGITITSGVLNDGGSQIVAGTNATLTIGASGTLCLGGTALSTSASCDSAGTATSTTATTMPAGFTSFNLGAASTVIYLSNGAQTVSVTPTYGNLYFRPFLTAGRIYTITGALTVAGNFDAKPLAATALALTVTMTGTWNVTGSFTVEGGGAGPAKTTFSTGTNRTLNTGSIILGDGTSATTFAANASAITTTGSWTNYAAFSAGTSNVTFNGATTATITGSTSFYDLTITHSSAKQVNFATASTPIFDVTHTFTVTGHSGALIKLYSDASPTQWQFHPTGTAAVDYADVKDGGCQVGSITITPTNSISSGNNDSCWSIASAQSLTFALSDNSIGFGTLSSSAARYCTGDTLGSSSETEGFNFSAATNATYGYNISVKGATLTSGGNTVAAIGGTNTASSVGTPQFGLRFTASGGSGAVAAPYAASGFAYAGTASTPTTVATLTTGDGVTTTYSARCLANISNTTPAGSYATSLTYVVTANF